MLDMIPPTMDKLKDVRVRGQREDHTLLELLLERRELGGPFKHSTLLWVPNELADSLSTLIKRGRNKFR